MTKSVEDDQICGDGWTENGTHINTSLSRDQVGSGGDGQWEASTL